jgi:hypothetical protein
MSKRNWARGAPPPAHSWEWAGIPQSAAVMMAGTADEKKEVAKTMKRGTELEKKRSAWPFAVGGFVLGLVLGSWES